MPVDSLHPAYLAHEQRAQRVRDAVAGTDAIKACGTEYLPHPSSDYASLSGDERKMADDRYAAYIKRASWLGVTGRTHEGMLGAVYRKAPSVELPTELEYMHDDADGSGMSLPQFARGLTSEVLQAGRVGVLVDYPEAEDGLTREQTQGLRATLRKYTSESIINWRKDGETLALLVLRESYDTSDDEFVTDFDWQYRVLRLEDGRYTQQVYRDGSPAGEKVEPRMADGSPWPVIPFAFIGARTNDETPDKPVLIDIADTNLAHYRNSADLEEAAFLSGQPMVHIDIGEATSEEWNQLNPHGITVGSRRGVQTKGGRIEMVQAEERNLLLSLMEQKERQMLAIGAKLITQQSSNETAEAVRSRSGSETASLSSVARNVSDGLENAMEWAGLFMTTRDVHDEITIELNQQFYPESFDAQQAMAMIQLGDRAVIGMTDLREWGRRVGIIDPSRTDDDINDDSQMGGIDLGAL